MKGRGPLTPAATEGLAIQALTFIAAEPERLGRFLALTGIGPTDIRAAAREPRFLAGILGYLASDERLAGAFSAETGCGSDDLRKACSALGGEPWEREVP